MIKTDSSRIGRFDAGKARKYVVQEDFVMELVAERWEQGDPIGKIELKDYVMARDDCKEGSEFFKQYLDPAKPSAGSGWTNWLCRALK